MTQNNPRLWQLAEIIGELETVIAAICEDETLTDGEREAQLEKAFTQWLEAGDSFNTIFLYSWQVSYPPLPPRRRGGWGGGGLGRLTISAITYEKWYKYKAERVAAYIHHQETLAEARKAEAKRIRTLAEQTENQVNRLRRYLTNEMLRTGQTRIDGVTVKVGLRRKPTRVMLNVPPEELPPEYVLVEYTPKLTKIKELLKSDDQKAIDWAFLSESHEYSLIIR